LKRRGRRVKGTWCPYCQTPISGVEVVASEAGKRPAPVQGTVVVCVDCGEVSVHDADLGGLRPLWIAEWIAAIADEIFWEALLETVARVKRAAAERADE
jgi:hypothetical protein